jgi:hypothetical protein
MKTAGAAQMRVETHGRVPEGSAGLAATKVGSLPRSRPSTSCRPVTLAMDDVSMLMTMDQGVVTVQRQPPRTYLAEHWIRRKQVLGGARPRVLHRRLTTQRCYGETQVTAPIEFPSPTGSPNGPVIRVASLKLIRGGLPGWSGL